MDAEYGRYVYLRRHRFTTFVYILALTLILLSIVQWMTLKYL